ncbi:MAG: hypothetical protein ABWX96_10955 [Propionibacteriaceae bacterium]
MSATTLEAPKTPVSASADPSTRTVRRPVRVRPAGRSGRSLAPRSRPAHPVAAPRLAPVVNPGVRSCTAEPVREVVEAPAAVRVRTRLTDRGIAVILVAGAMIVLAAVTVVGLTAFQVTSDSYQPLSSSSLAQP